ncbi:MAG: hypothetical protein RSB41_00785 [Bacilli bacterium]
MKKKFLMIFTLVAVAVVMFPLTLNAAANEITIEGATPSKTYATLTEALNDAKATGDTILLGEGTYTLGETIVSKDVTIKGAGAAKTKIEGNLVVNNNLKLSDLELNCAVDSVNTINVMTKSNVSVNNVVIGSVKAALRVSKDAIGSTVTILDSKLTGKYGVFLRSEKLTVTVKNTTISGYSTIDSGASKTLFTDGRKSSNNVVLVEGCTLTGVNNFATLPNNNEYSVILIGGQKDSKFTFNNNTISNSVSTKNGEGNQEDLIGTNNTYYLPNENIDIIISNSVLSNTDKLHNSYVLALEELSSTKTNLVLDGNTVKTDKDKYIAPIVIGKITYVNVTVKDFNLKETLKTVEKGTKLAALTAEKVDGYTFDAYYNEKVKYDFDTVVDKDLVLTAKYTKNPVNPQTGDNALIYGLIGVIGAVGIGFALISFKSRI